MRMYLILLATVSGILFSVVSSAAEEMALDKIVVTPYRYEESLSRVPSNVTVIGVNEITESNAQRVINVLRPVPGLVVRDFYGNAAAATVDIAGFGEQGALNVLVLIDGRRVNDVDLSGVDWTQIPLDQVERIEVLRGGSAGVLYGDNASSGVINIITKKGSGKPKVNLETEYGSYDLNKQKLSLEGGIDNTSSYWIDVGRESTNGFRNNTFEKMSNFASKFEHSFNDMLSAHFSSGFHASTYGIPSGLFQHHIDEYGRRWARYGEDHTNNKDYYFFTGSRAEFAGAGCLDLDVSYRKKDSDSFFLTSHNDTRRNDIETFGVTPKYTLGNSIFEHDNKFISGLDFYRVVYTSNNYPYSNDTSVKNYTHTNKNSLAGYLHDELSIFKHVVLAGGYRCEAARYVFGYHDFTGVNPDRASKLTPTREAFDSGLVYTYKDDSSVFFNVGKSFRFPEVDEFIGNYDINFHQFLNTDLKPQSSINYQLGVRHSFTDRLKGDLSLFRMKVHDFIYFNPVGGIFGFGENENYAESVHEGVESSLNAKLTGHISLSGAYSFTRAFFDGGQYDKNEIPMVPRHTGSIGLNFILPRDITLNVTGTYVGKRYFINDQANAYSRLNGYMVADTNLSWRHKDLTVTVGINNLFDKKYSEYGVIGTDSSNGFVYDKCYFPTPGRNFNLKVSYTF